MRLAAVGLRSRLGLWLTIGAIALIVVLFIMFIDLGEVIAQIRRADWRDLVGASGFLVAGMGVYAFRWRLLLAGKPGRLVTYHAANVGHMFNILLPLRAGEPARIVYLGTQSHISVAEVASSVFVERQLEQIMRIAALGGAILFGAGVHISWETILGVFVFLILAFGFLFWMVHHRQRLLADWPPFLGRLPRLSEQRARQVLSELLDGLSSISSPGRLVMAFLSSLLCWSLFWGYQYLTLAALGINLSLLQKLAISVGALALSPPSAPTQPGIFHASVVVPLAAIGFDRTMLTSYAVILHALQMVWMIGMGLWGLSRSGFGGRELLKSGQMPPG